MIYRTRSTYLRDVKLPVAGLKIRRERLVVFICSSSHRLAKLTQNCDSKLKVRANLAIENPETSCVILARDSFS